MSVKISGTEFCRFYSNETLEACFKHWQTTTRAIVEFDAVPREAIGAANGRIVQ